VLGVVGKLDRLVLGRERHHRRDRAEHLLVEDRAPGLHLVEHRGRVEEAGTRQPLAAGAHTRSAVDGIGDQTLDLVARRLIDQGSELRSVCEPLRDAHGGHGIGEPIGESARDRLVDEEAVGGCARLTAVAHLRCHRAGDRHVDVSVLEDDERRVAAELHRRADDTRRTQLEEPTADRRRAGERELAHACVAQDRFHERRRLVGAHDVHHALGHAGLVQQARDRDRGQRRLLSRLDHDRAAGGERRTELPRGHGSREVPRCDQQRDADRVMGDQHPVQAAGRDGVVPVRPHRLLREPAQELGGVGHLAARLGQRLAHLADDQAGQLVGAGDHPLVRAPQDLAALARRPGRPLAGGRGRRGDGGDPVVGPGGLERLDRLARGRVDDVEMPQGGRGGHASNSNEMMDTVQEVRKEVDK
jgi:ParB family chromosome partitioning protein